jgi:tetratricopeptide (TPR) repeat protein
MAGGEPPDIQADEAITLIDNARQNRTEGYFYPAEAQYRRALAIVEQISGAQSPDLTPALNGLAELYFDARRYTEAEALARRSAAVVEASLGAGHSLMATALHNLAAIYHVQGQYAKAEPLYLRALAIREATPGPNHPFVAATLADLAELESAQGNYESGGGALCAGPADSSGRVWNRRCAGGGDAGRLCGGVAQDPPQTRTRSQKSGSDSS